MSYNNQKIIIFSAPSGSGKTTLVNHCLEIFPKLEFSISGTTRKPRGEEKNGKEYYFFSVEEFKNKVDLGDFIEHEEVYPGTFYGTLKSEVERIWEKGNIVIFDVDVQGGLRLKKIFGDKALGVFIAPPSIKELERRLNSRNTDTDESIKIRIEKARKEMTHAGEFDTTIINEDLSLAKAKIARIMSNFLEI